MDTCKTLRELLQSSLMKVWLRNVFKYGNLADRCPIQPVRTVSLLCSKVWVKSFSSAGQLRCAQLSAGEPQHSGVFASGILSPPRHKLLRKAQGQATPSGGHFHTGYKVLLNGNGKCECECECKMLKWVTGGANEFQLFKAAFGLLWAVESQVHADKSLRKRQGLPSEMHANASPSRSFFGL